MTKTSSRTHRKTRSASNDPTHPTILVVDDDPTTRQVLTVLLESEGYRVRCASDGAECLDSLPTHNPDLVLLDILLPIKNGRQVCREIRQITNTPIIMLSALTIEQEKVGRLNDGADDYLSKPYDNDELLARIRAVLRRVRPNSSGRQYHDNQIHIDFDAHQLFVKGNEVTLSPKEWRLLEYLQRHQGRTVDRQTLLRHVWGRNYAEAYPYLKVYVSNLRRKLGDPSRRPRYIHTAHEAGYRFEGYS